MKEKLAFCTLKISDQFKIRHSDVEAPSERRGGLCTNEFKHPTERTL